MNRLPGRHHLSGLIETVLGAYASVLFDRQKLTGLCCLAATLIYPRVFLGGLGALLVAEFWLRWFGLPAHFHPSVRFNVLLTGLAIAAFWAPQTTIAWPLIFIVATSGTVMCTIILEDILGKNGNLPVLSLPFTLAILTIIPLGGGLSPAIPVLPYGIPTDHPVGALLCTLGTLFLSPHPLSGILVLLGMLYASRWLTFLAVVGYSVGLLTLHLLWEAEVTPVDAFSFPLIAMAVGGVYHLPNRTAFFTALFAVVLGAFIVAAKGIFTHSGSSMLLSAPFVLATLGVLWVGRHARQGLVSVLSHPDLPEHHAENQALASHRLGPAGSLPLRPPFMGTWHIYQGADGIHTHRGNGRYALDFFVTEEGQSFRDTGESLEHYRCYGLPVLAPADGLVTFVCNDQPDNPPGQINEQVGAYWGNTVVLQTASGLYIRLAHLQKNSISVAPGAWVGVGTPLGTCGNSGRSPQPHLHMQVQDTLRPDAHTLPFHLDNILSYPSGLPPLWHLAYLPQEGEAISSASRDTALAEALALSVGQDWQFEVFRQHEAWKPWSLEVIVTFSGQIRWLHGTASVAAISGPHAFALYDREGNPDLWLDLLTLSIGLTPFAETTSWEDAPPARLFPVPWLMRLWLAISRPLGHALHSEYRRQTLNSDWEQRGRHLLRLGPGWTRTLHTCVRLSHDGRFLEVSAQSDNQIYAMRRVSITQHPDAGIPGWHDILHNSSNSPPEGVSLT